MDMGSLLGGGGLVTLILAAGTGIWRWIDRQDRKKDPIPKDQAAVALSADAVEVSRVVLAEVRSEMETMRAELANERSHRNELETRVEKAEGRVSDAEAAIRHHESMFGAAMSYIEALLRHIREGLARPAPPVPGALRDLIDPSLHD